MLSVFIFFEGDVSRNDEIGHLEVLQFKVFFVAQPLRAGYKRIVIKIVSLPFTVCQPHLCKGLKKAEFVYMSPIISRNSQKLQQEIINFEECNIQCSYVQLNNLFKLIVTSTLNSH